jgi:lipid-A-disaccharide synthase
LKDSILIIAGEASGDNVGGLLASELKLLRPDIELFGLGGDRMDISGVEIRYHINQLSFLGFWEVLKHIPFIKEVERDLLNQIRERRPSLAVLIDYPGFNLRLAGKLRSLNIPIMYYVSPQIWAWGRGRISKIKKLVDKMVVVFQFEKEMYEKEEMSVEWHGHPLLEIVKPRYKRAEFIKKLGVEPGLKYIGIFPGSRKQEIEKILPVMKKAVEAATSPGLDLRGIVGCAPGIDIDFYRKICGDDMLYVRGLIYDLMEYAELNLVASGTATLESAILNKPVFILYKISALTYLIAKRLVKIPYVGLVNVVAGEKIVPEFIQKDCRSDLIAGEIELFFSDSGYRRRMMERLSSVKNMLGTEGASKKAAETALRMMVSLDD